MSEKKERIVLDVAYQPQVRTNTDTKRIMLDVIIALIPAVIVAVIQFGFYPLVVIASSVASFAVGISTRVLAQPLISTLKRSIAAANAGKSFAATLA